MSQTDIKALTEDENVQTEVNFKMKMEDFGVQVDLIDYLQISKFLPSLLSEH